MEAQTAHDAPWLNGPSLNKKVYAMYHPGSPAKSYSCWAAASETKFERPATVGCSVYHAYHGGSGSGRFLHGELPLQSRESTDGAICLHKGPLQRRWKRWQSSRQKIKTCVENYSSYEYSHLSHNMAE